MSDSGGGPPVGPTGPYSQPTEPAIGHAPAYGQQPATGPTPYGQSGPAYPQSPAPPAPYGQPQPGWAPPQPPWGGQPHPGWGQQQPPGAAWPPQPSGWSPGGYPGNAYPYRPWYVSPLILSRVTICLLAVNVALNCGEIAARANGNALGVGLIAIFTLLALIGCGIAFSMWTYRIYKNLQAFGVQGLSTSPGWAVGYLYIPIAWIYKPIVIFNEAFRASGPSNGPSPFDWQANPTTPLIAAWWTFWAIGNIGSSIENFGHNSDLMATTFRVSPVFFAIAGVLGIFAINLLTARQDEHAAAVGLLNPSR